jgi:hypothetical protein
VEVYNLFAEWEEAEREKREFGELLVQRAQQHFEQKVVFTVRESWLNDEVKRALEYQLKLVVPKKHFLGITRKPVIAQVVRYLGKIAEWHKRDFIIVVFKPEHEEIARDVAALLPLVYGDRIKILVQQSKVEV